MSTNRVSPDAGWVDLKKHPKGPNGRGLCRQCGKEVSKGSRTFCSQACIDRWKIKTSPSHVRVLLYRRDKGVCALCGLDTDQWAAELRLEWARIQREKDVSAYRAFRDANTLFFRRTSYWDADHIVPVVEGGGECDLDNYRTLCIPCHKQVTAQLAARRAAPRRAERAAAQAARELAAGKVRLF